MDAYDAERIAGIRARLAEITPSPWGAQGGGEIAWQVLSEGRGSGPATFLGAFRAEADARFAACAPSDVRYLLELVGRLARVRRTALPTN